MMFHSGKHHRLFTLIGTALIAGGVFILGWVAYDILRPKTLPYERVLVDEGKPAKFPKLGLKNDRLTVRKYEIRTGGVDKPLAEFHVAHTDKDLPIPLSWESKLAEPVLFMDVEPAAEQKVAQVMAKHVPKDAIIYSWWDNSRRLKLYNNLPVAFGESKPHSILVPRIWTYQAKTIQNNEESFWRGKINNANAQTGDFADFHNALLMEPHAGVEALRKMAKGKRLFVALNLLDSYKIGGLSPNQFGIGYKDFPRSKQSHGLIKGVKSWIKENGYTAYSVYPMNENIIRIFFLTDQTSKYTLLASLLPFDSSKPGQTPGTTLVYQHRGYWIYEINPQSESNNSPLPKL